ncbi:GNAT family N-acetyltransferase [Dysgonomonas macrotermitis]|uniref:Acetyltransferase (GNAT) domain-containing protein n=1 Tax=Dysgonomonas macrotermitis TaxID=1346286 RepID=A0A1M5IB62_9BACT|nr:GNAT family N-acetyltransferase [Dysgonomonas macrotermitis]SHG25140.1 Acetyltransferase (GNAT) domain-containing protein [Dysgonomonas macrotermitis]
MIQFANTDTTPLVRSMWKTCFEDTEEYLDLHFTRKYKPENTLLYFEDGVAVAALQMLPYSIRFYGEVVSFYYLAGLCTLPEYRNKGYMGQLINTSFEVMKEREVALCGLVPAEEWLFSYYSKYGFTVVFDSSENTIELKPMLKSKDPYSEFDKKYQQSNFTVLKNRNDFEAIIIDYLAEDCPPKGNLRGMARVLLPEKALGLFAKKNPDKNFSLKVENQAYKIENGKVDYINSSAPDIDISLFTRLLFGYHTSLLDAEYASQFDEHQPVINLMLE